MSDATPGIWEAVHIHTASAAPAWMLPLMIVAALVAAYWLTRVAAR